MTFAQQQSEVARVRAYIAERIAEGVQIEDPYLNSGMYCFSYRRSKCNLIVSVRSTYTAWKPSSVDWMAFDTVAVKSWEGEFSYGHQDFTAMDRAVAYWLYSKDYGGVL